MNNQNLRIKISLYINYFVFAILLNSVGIVIQKALNNYGVTEIQASILEAFKDLPIAIVSFLLASFLPRIGYKKAMLAALAIVFLGCISMYFGNTFNATKILFLTVGVSFALIKLSVYSIIGLVTNGKEEHASMMSSIEGFFMFGIASAYFIFPAFYSETNPDAWLNVYPFLAVLVGLSFLFLLFSKIEMEETTAGDSLGDDLVETLKLLAKPLVIVFVFSAFFFVMIEQGMMTWLPRFNEKIFSFSEVLSVQMASILAISMGLGRFLAGWLAKKLDWTIIVAACLLISASILFIVLPKLVVDGERLIQISNFADIPFLGFVLPMIGLFIAPIYPLLNSTVLSALPTNLHAPMSGLIIIFSALGGTLGSRIVGWLFGTVGGTDAFYFLLIPMAILLVIVFILKKMTQKTV